MIDAHSKLKEDTLSSIVFEHNPNGIVITDSDMAILMVNPKFTEITEYSLADVVGKTPRFLLSKRHDELFFQEMAETLRTTGLWQGEVWNTKKTGVDFPEKLVIKAATDQAGNTTNFIGMFSDLSDTKKAQSDIEQLLYKDKLTGLPNALALQEFVHKQLKAEQKYTGEAALLFIDLDKFKYINDTLGHHIGDILLEAVAARLGALMDEGVLLSRQGGDEFVIFTTTLAGSALEDFCQRIIASFATPFKVGPHQLSITTSIGVACYPKDGDDFDSLSRCADTALNFVKTNGRKNYKFHEISMSNALNEQVSLEVDLQSAVEKQQLELHYQAIVDLQTGRISGLEAFIRWNHPELGVLSPIRFIPLAEENDTINRIGEWILDTACANVREAMDAEIAVPPIALNFSPKQFRESKLVDNLKNALTKYDLAATAIGVEITESALMQNGGISLATLKAIKQLGCSLSLDDFGTGYSSLSYLKTFSFDKVKIDRSFVHELSKNKQDAAIVIAIVGMAHSLGIKVLAEGVETEDQCDFLRNNMVDEIQGFLFAKPVIWQEAKALISAGYQLPSHLLRITPASKVLLLVDDEQNIVSSLKRLLRRDGYQILTANGGAEGLAILAENHVDVIISDQRMPGMTGVEFLSKVKEIHPDTIRIVLSGYTELNSVTDAINEGAVFRFLTKPWNDEKLRDSIKEAFQYKQFADDNHQLSLKVQTTNHELASANRQLAESVASTQNQLSINSRSFGIVQEALKHIKAVLIGLDEDNLIAFINDAAVKALEPNDSLLGEELRFISPALYQIVTKAAEGEPSEIFFKEKRYEARWHLMGTRSHIAGKIVILD